MDHTRYKKKDDEPDEGIDLVEQSRQIEEDEGESKRKRRRTSESESEEERPMIKEERDLAKLIQDHDEDDPMKAFLVQEKKEEVALALAELKDGKRPERRHHRHHHRSRPKDESKRDRDSRRSRPEEEGERHRDSRHSRHRRDGHRSRRSHSRD